MIHLVWTGRGWIVPALTALVILLGVYLTDGIGLRGASANVTFGFAILTAGVAVWGFGKAWNREPLRDSSGALRPFMSRHRHTFWYMPIEWWGLLAVAIAIYGLTGILIGDSS